MIVTFGNKLTEKIWNGIASPKMSISIQELTRRKLRMLNAAVSLNDLMIPPSNRLEKLKGGLHVYHSIRVNRQWRLIFRWENNNSYDVTLIDYH
jgi:toxin HigB-1